MKTKLNFKICFLLYISLLLFVSCEEVIDIDLNSSQSVLVAEGTIFKDSVAYFRLSMTSDYFDDKSSSVIEDAIVTLTDDMGYKEQLHYTENGIYMGKNILGTVGRNYTISFLSMGKNYSAHAKLIAPAEILDVSIEEAERWRPHRSLSDKIEYSINVSFSDDPETDNFYRLRYCNNNKEINEKFFLATDLFAKNNVVETRLHAFDLVEGDFRVAVLTIDESTYKYYRQLNEIGGVRMSTSTPYNPISNFGREVMGYFTALSYSEVKGEF